MTVLAAPEQVGSVDRAALARSILARAEERTGTSRWVRPVALPTLAAEVGDTSLGGVAGLSGAAARSAAEPEPAAAEQSLPVDARLADLLPSRGLDRGTTVVVAGSTSLVLGLLVEASRGGSWVAVVGLPAVGVLAAAQMGLDLDRVVLVPDPGPDGPQVVAALLDGMDVVVVGPRATLLDGDRRRLSARARERSSVLVPTTTWTGANVVLTAVTSRWEGLGQGHGRLRSRRLRVERHGRGSAAQVWHGEVALPLQGTPAVVVPLDRRRWAG